MGKILDRALETTTTTGTGAIVFDGKIDGYVSFTDSVAFQTGDSIGPWLDVNYQIEQRNESGVPVDWEIGVGKLFKPTGTSPYITRDTIRSSSNGGAKVDFGSGTKTVWSAPQSADFNGNITIQTEIISESVFGLSSYSGIPGYNYIDVSPSPAVDPAKTAMIARVFGDETWDTLLWRMTDDGDMRLMVATDPPSVISMYVTLITGLPRVRHIEVDFGTVGAAGTHNLGPVSIGVTLHNYQRAAIIPCWSGVNIQGDARIDSIVSYLLNSNTTVSMTVDTNDSGDVILPLQIIEF